MVGDARNIDLVLEEVVNFALEGVVLGQLFGVDVGEGVGDGAGAGVVSVVRLLNLIEHILGYALVGLGNRCYA